MIRGTTPTFTLTLNDNTIDLTQAVNVYATFKQGDKVLTKTGEDITVTAKTVEVYLNQEETLSFLAGSKVAIQLNWTYAEGKRACSNIVAVDINHNLIGSVLA